MVVCVRCRTVTLRREQYEKEIHNSNRRLPRYRTLLVLILGASRMA